MKTAVAAISTASWRCSSWAPPKLSPKPSPKVSPKAPKELPTRGAV